MRKKPIPKFLHRTKKNHIGKRISSLFGRDDILSLEIDFTRHWTERRTVTVRTNHQWDNTLSVEDLLSNAGTLDEFHDCINDHDYVSAQQHISEAVEEYEDYMCDVAYEYGEEVDREELDEEYEETIDSGTDISVTNSRQNDNINQDLRRFQVGLWWEHITSYMLGLRSMPYSEHQIMRMEEDY